MAIKGAIGVIADDLTGANDTALQFFIKGANTEIIFETDDTLQNHQNVETWALTTESRNIDSKEAAKKVWENAKKIKDFLPISNYYKKIDSTLRGNIAYEVLSMLDAIEYDAAVIAPAFIQEGRITIGGYQLSKGIPIERTDAARDTKSPIYDSYIPDILKKQLDESYHDLIECIELKTVAKGALSITRKLDELISEGKKLIIADSASLVDLEQIALSVNKSRFNVLPVGSAGFASSLSEIWLPDSEREKINKKIPALPKIILSGSKTSITSNQIKNLLEEEDFESIYEIALCLDDILHFDEVKMADRIISNLRADNVAIVHVSKLTDEVLTEENKEKLIDEGITRENLASLITDVLSKLASELDKRMSFVLITIGGETSAKCTKELKCSYLQVIDSVLPAIPLCLDSNARFIVTKSGNLGTSSALVDIVNYFKHHEKE